MTSRELRNQRREAERKARKLAYRESRNAVSAAASAPESSFIANPDLFDEFSAEELTEMMALRARVHARAGIADLPEAPVPSEIKSGAPGPRTLEGKATSSGNSLKHGLASGRIIIPGEDPAAFEALLSDLLNEHAPANETESLLVQQMAQSWWLTQRAIRLQNQVFTDTDVDTHKLALFLRYQTTHERAFYRALNSLITLQKERRKSAPQFVSQSPSQTLGEIGFVSQNASKDQVEPPDAGLQPGNLGYSIPSADR